MPPANPLTDDYVAKLLAQDAANLSSGLSRRSDRAPKPNTRFLKNILREADGHNTALKRKEEQEAGERKRQLGREERRRGIRTDRRNGRLTPPADDADVVETGRRVKRRRVEEDRTHRQEPRSRGADSRRSRSHSRERTYPTHKLSDRDSDCRTTQHPRKQRRPTDRGRSPSRHRHRRRKSKDRDRTLSVEYQSSKRKRREDDKQQGRRQVQAKCHHSEPRDASESSDSDPLEGLIGPRPPSPHAKTSKAVRGRGRGTFTSNALDHRFNADYDPAADVQPDSEAQQDDWEGALEALRDRQKWKQIGAQRLREAGFGETDIKKWERGKSAAAGGEGDIDDVRWSKRGEDREWDKGKILDEDSVGAAAAWGGLKVHE